LQDRFDVAKPITTEREIKEALGKKPSLPKPFKLALHFKRLGPGNCSPSKWRWTDEDKNLLLEVAKQLKDQRLISDAFAIPGSLIDGKDL
jgi:hypothetical protein